jgi:RNA-directed DNA polymerase
MKNYTEHWYQLPWKEYEKDLLDMQFEIAATYMSGNLRHTRQLISELTKHEAAISIAVKRVTAKTSRHTPGLDGIIWAEPSQRLEGREWLRETAMNISSYKAQGVKRVWIPKDNSKELRPLGIPTVQDKAVQILWLLSMEPVTETQADENSYGFRPFRGCATAIAKLRSNLDKKFYSDTWIYDADISKCFDSISHEFLLKNAITHNKGPLKQWLTAPIYETIIEGPNVGQSIVTPNTRGTPQGGVISPILCNIALDGLQEVIEIHNNRSSIRKFNRPGQNRKLKIVRYADDFVVLSPNKCWIDNIVPDIKKFLKIRGLRINDKKTACRHIKDGFDFLGWEIKRRANTRDNETKKRNDPYYQPSTLVIRPQPKKVASLKKKLRDEVFKKKEYLMKPPHMIFQKHNEIMRGWCCYYWTSYHSQAVFIKLAHWQWYNVIHFFKRKHADQKRTTLWIQKKYTEPYQGEETKTTKDHFRKWTWTTTRPSRRDPLKQKKFRLLDPSTVKHKKVLNHKNGMNIYTKEGRAYWVSWWNSEQLFTNSFRSDLHHRDNLTCDICGQSAYYYGNDDGNPMIELHHVEPWITSRNDHPDNLVTVHTECHPAYHQPNMYGNDDVNGNSST